MSLSIPTRKKPGERSFPTSPEAVRAWVKSLQPMDNVNSMRQLYRGIKHSNRLETSNSNRITVAEILEPAIFEVLLILEELYIDQPLPLPKKAKHAHQLAVEILKEFAFTHKIIVNDTYATLLPGQSNTRSIGIFKALRALSKLIEIQLKTLSPVPATLLQDANTMFHYALKSNLELSTHDSKIDSINTSWSIENIYIYIQLLALATPYNHRRRQIPLLCTFLSEQATQLSIQNLEEFRQHDKKITESSTPLSECVFGIHLNQDTKPHLARFAENTAAEDLRYLNLQTLHATLDTAIKNAPEIVSSLFESEQLSQSTLKEFKQTLLRTRKRNTARAITHQSVRAKTGLPEIANSLHYSPADIQLDQFSMLDSSDTLNCWPPPVINQNQSWIIVNKNRYGACLEWRDQHITEAEIGELVAWHMDTGDADTAWMIGTIRWLKMLTPSRLLMGIEYYARSASSITVDTLDEDNTSATRPCLLTKNSTKNQNFDQHTLIAPAMIFKEDETVKTREGGSYQLTKKVESTPACDFFEVREIQTA